MGRLPEVPLRRLLIPLAVGLIALSACTRAPTPSAAPPPSPAPSPKSAAVGAAALVNGTPIARASLDRRLEVQKALLQGLDLGSDQGRAIEAQLAADTLNQLIDTEVLRQAAAAQGVTVTPAEIDQRLNAPVEGEAWGVMKAALNAQSVDPDYYRSLMEQQILSEQMMAKIVPEIPATAEQVRIRRIAVETEADAQAALADLKAGQDFAQVALARSIDPESRPRGGDVGFYPRGIVAPEVEDVAFALPVGGISEPFKTPLGYEILQVAERSPDRPVPAQYQQLIRDRKFTDWLKQQRAQAKVEYPDAKG